MAEAGERPPEDQAAFRQLLRVVRDLEPAPVGQVELMAAAWGLVHGVASLVLDGPLGGGGGDRDRALGLVDRLIERLQP